MSIKATLNDDLKNAMRAREKAKLDALRLIMAAIKQIEVDERIDVDDARMLVILDKLSKQRKESITQFKAANRLDLVEKEEFELAIIQQYLPEPLSDVEVDKIIEDALKTLDAKAIGDMGRVMAHLKTSLQGRADMSKVSALIKAKLNG